MAGRTYSTEAVVLRSFRLGEADRVLHLYTLDRGRIGAIAKGIRKTKSRFGARLEPLSHVTLMLHQGSGELQTVTGVDLVASHRESREVQYRLAVGLVGAEAMLRLFSEQERNERAFQALTRFLELLDALPARAVRPAAPRTSRAGLRRRPGRVDCADGSAPGAARRTQRPSGAAARPAARRDAANGWYGATARRNASDSADPQRLRGCPGAASARRQSH